MIKCSRPDSCPTCKVHSLRKENAELREQVDALTRAGEVLLETIDQLRNA